MTMSIDFLKKPESYIKPKSADPVEEIMLQADKRVCFDIALNNAIKEELVNLLKSKIITFAWHPEEVTGVDPAIITYRLNIDSSVKPVQQKKRKIFPERQQVIKDEINKLLNAGLIKEVQYPTWLQCGTSEKI